MKKKLLIIGLVWPEPKSSAAGKRMMNLVNLFLRFKYQVIFVSPAVNIEFSEDLSSLGIITKIIKLNSSTFDNFIIQLNPNIVLFDRFIIEEQFGWRISEFVPDALKILNTEDLHFLRKGRENALRSQRDFFSEDLFSDITKREIASVFRCDISLLVSQFEMELLQKQFKISKNLLYYLPIFASKERKIISFNKRNDFVFIGNFLHDPNTDCVKYLKEVIWPLLHIKLPNARLLIYGAYPTSDVLKLNDPKNNFFIIGRADDAIKVISNAKVLLAPLRFGAGIKGKLIEAMQCGTPSVTSSIGAEAIADNFEWNGFIKDDPQEFVNAAIMLYQEENLWRKCQENGFRIIEKRFKKSLFENNFIKDINSLIENLSQHRKENFIGSILQHHTNMSTKYMSKWIEEKNKIK